MILGATNPELMVETSNSEVDISRWGSDGRRQWKLEAVGCKG